MKVKKYTAPTMPEAMNKIRHELGSEAVILDSKVIYLGGFLGLFKKRSIQVIAALDKQPMPVKSPLPRKTVTDSPIPKQQVNDQQTISKDVLIELKEMKKWMEKNGTKDVPAYPLPLQMLYHHLMEKEIETEYIREWLDDLASQLQPEGHQLSSREVKEKISGHLETKLEEHDFSGIDYKKKYIHLAGPTGVGKTTTIAKLAANAMLKDHKKVALITTDTYRIAAIDQLKTYAKILEIPLEIAYDKNDYNRAKEKFSDYDLVLIDTAGRNFLNQQLVAEFENLIELKEDGEVYLVLSLASKLADQKAIYEHFRSFPVRQFIFTKEDETSSYGSIVNMLLFSGIGAAYITNGQEVPDNISELSVRKINQLIVGDFAND